MQDARLFPLSRPKRKIDPTPEKVGTLKSSDRLLGSDISGSDWVCGLS